MCWLANDSTQLRLQLHDAVYKPTGFAAESVAHGAAVGEVFKSIEGSPSDLHVICDSDTVVLQPKWDVTVQRFLQLVDCVGGAYEALDSSSRSRVSKYQNTPHMTWLALKPGLPWHRFEPQRPFVSDIHVGTDADALLWGLPIGFDVTSDACWNFPIFLRDNQLTSLGLRDTIPNYKALAGFRPIHDEWELPDGTPFVVHQRRAIQTPFRAEGFSREFYDRCDELLHLGRL